jgi:hypothetical protein
MGGVGQSGEGLAAHSYFVFQLMGPVGVFFFGPLQAIGPGPPEQSRSLDRSFFVSHRRVL